MINTVTALLYVFKDAAAVSALLSIMHCFFLCDIKIKKIPAVLLAGAIIFNSFFSVFFLQEHIGEYGRAVSDLVSTVLYLVVLRVFAGSRGLLKNIMTVFFTAFTVEMLYSLATPYIGDKLYTECIFSIVLFAFITILINAAVKRLQINFLPGVFEEIPRWIYFVIMLFDLTCYYKEFGLSEGWYGVLYIISSVGVVFCALFLVFRIFHMAHRQNEILNQLAVQKDFGEKTILSDEELRRFRHDYKNHMIVVNAYLESGKIDEAREYLNSISSGIGGTVNKIKTGNFVSDAILNSKAVSAAGNGTKISFSGIIPQNGIESEDLCTVLANLIDNAAEACEKLPGEKTIDVEARKVAGYFILNISNPTSGAKNPKLKPTNNDRRNQGIGLKNVERALKKYNGALSTENENGVFTAGVRFELPAHGK